MTSHQRPWLRGALVSVTPLLLPFVWVLELDSCGGQTVQNELTGFTLFSKFELEFEALLFVVLAVMVLTPFAANRLARAGHRVWVHLLGLVASGFAAWLMGLVLFFVIFRERVLRLPGGVVLALFGGALLDGVVRFGASVREWWATRR